MRVAIFNVRYSPNLGDGLLAECLARELVAAAPGIEIAPIDLAGRDSFPTDGGQRQRRMQILERLPPQLRRLSAFLALSWLARSRLRPMWRKQLATADAVIIGGGNLFADADLNFPMKISAALSEAKRRDLPVCVYGVGATDNWSRTGASLFGRSLKAARLISASVRDERSREVWNKQLGHWQVRPATISVDPGLLTSVHYPSTTSHGDQPVLALCITAPIAIRYHSDQVVEDHVLARWYGETAGAFADRGWHVRLFTNGSPEDQVFLSENGAAWRRNSPRISIAPAFESPSELATFTSACDLVMAHRMHACIAAYSYGIPVIGLLWDRKLNSFFELIEAPDMMLQAGKATTGETLALAERARREGVNQTRHGELVNRCKTDVQELATLLIASSL